MIIKSIQIFALIILYLGLFDDFPTGLSVFAALILIFTGIASVL